MIAFERLEGAETTSTHAVPVLTCALRIRVAVCLIALLSLPYSSAARALPAAERATPQEEIRVTEAVRVDRAPKLDGTLNDPLWQLAKPITDFRQQEPNEGQPATERTEDASCTRVALRISESTAMTRSRLELLQRNSGAT